MIYAGMPLLARLRQRLRNEQQTAKCQTDIDERKNNKSQVSSLGKFGAPVR